MNEGYKYPEVRLIFQFVPWTDSEMELESR